MYYRYMEEEESTKTACLMIWPDGNPLESLMDHIYQLIFFLLTYVVPMLGLSITYTHLGLVLWTSGLDPDQDKPNSKIKEKRKVIH